jgi:hypothetical protein
MTEGLIGLAKVMLRQAMVGIIPVRHCLAAARLA